MHLAALVVVITCEVEGYVALEINQLMALRPSDDSSAAVQDSLRRIDEAILAVETKLPVLEAKRSKLLLEGSGAEIKAIDQQRADATVDLEQLAALLEAVRPMVLASKQKEITADLQAKAAIVAAALRESDQWFRDRYGSLVAELGQALDQRNRVLRQRDELFDLTTAVRKGGFFTEYDTPHSRIWAPKDQSAQELRTAIQLPVLKFVGDEAFKSASYRNGEFFPGS